jgi:hypothetical protein
MHSGFTDVDLLNVSAYKIPSSDRYTLLTRSYTIELHGYICRSIIIIANTLDFQKY